MYVVLDDDKDVIQYIGYDTVDNKKVLSTTLQNQFNIKYPDFGLLPPVVKYISPITNTQCAVIIEAQPTRRNLRYSDGILRELPIPWQHWFIHFNTTSDGQLGFSDCALLFSKTQLQDEDHMFYSPYLTNLDVYDIFYGPLRSNGSSAALALAQSRRVRNNFTGCYCRPCWGDNGPWFTPPPGPYPLSKLWSSINFGFWSTPFNYDYGDSSVAFVSSHNDGDHSTIDRKQALDKISRMTIADATDKLSAEQFTFAEYLTCWHRDDGIFSLTSLLHPIEE